MDDLVALSHESRRLGASGRGVREREASVELVVVAACFEPLHRGREDRVLDDLTEPSPVLDLLG
jgi:hypothetical protein